MMNYHDKTKNELIIELQKLQQEYNSLKLSYEKDISERKLAEEALRESEIRYRELFNNISNGVAIYEVTGNGNDFIFKDFNRAGERIDGDLKENIIGKSIYELRPGINKFGLLEVFKRVFATGIPEHYPVRFYMDEKLQGWYDNFVYRLPSGEIVAVYDNITERKQADEKLRLEKENFRNSLDDSPLGVRIATIEGNTIYANKTLLNYYGYDSLGELQKTPLKDRYTPESYDESQKRKRQRQRGDFSATDYEISIVRKNGEIRHLQAFRKDVLWEGVRQFQVICNDITEHKQAEEEIRKSTKLLEDLNKHLIEIRENERALISREIHDQIGQSLTVLKLDLNWMHKYANTNPETVVKLKVMIELVSNTIKDVQRISSDLRPGILDDLGLVSAIEWYSEEFEKRTGIKCSQKLENSDYSNSQINLTFFRALQETLTNVIRHASASSVNIKLCKSPKGTILTITDDGIGIPEEKIESHKSLGLIGMRERVRQFNGKIDISSKKGKGTKLTVFIPGKEGA